MVHKYHIGDKIKFITFEDNQVHGLLTSEHYGILKKIEYLKDKSVFNRWKVCAEEILDYDLDSTRDLKIIGEEYNLDMIELRIIESPKFKIGDTVLKKNNLLDIPNKWYVSSVETSYFISTDCVELQYHYNLNNFFDIDITSSSYEQNIQTISIFLKEKISKSLGDNFFQNFY